MDLALWIVAGLATALFLATGIAKLVTPKDVIVEKGQNWAKGFSPVTIKALGAAEVLGAIGIMVPPLVGITPILSPVAAVALAALMVAAIVVHVRIGDSVKQYAGAIMGLVFALVVAVGRLFIAPF